MFDLVSKYYEMFFSEVSGNRSFTFAPKDIQRKTINNFIKYIPETAGEDWLFDYFTFQFSRYFDKKTRFGVGIVMLNWVVSKKALEEYRNRTDQQIYFAELFKTKYRIINHKPTNTNKNSVFPLIKDEIRSVKDIVNCSNSMFKIKEIFSKNECGDCKYNIYCNNL